MSQEDKQPPETKNRLLAIDQIEKQLKRELSPISLGIGVLNMVNHTALVIALVFLILGWVIDRYFWFGSIIVFFCRHVLKSQFTSRIMHVRKLAAFKFEDGELYVYDKHGLRHSWRRITRIRRDSFLHCDPWRPITIGYPGIEIILAGQGEPIEHLCAYGMEEDRDEIFDLIQQYLKIRASRRVLDD